MWQQLTAAWKVQAASTRYLSCCRADSAQCPQTALLQLITAVRQCRFNFQASPTSSANFMRALKLPEMTRHVELRSAWLVRVACKGTDKYEYTRSLIATSAPCRLVPHREHIINKVYQSSRCEETRRPRGEIPTGDETVDARASRSRPSPFRLKHHLRSLLTTALCWSCCKPRSLGASIGLAAIAAVTKATSL